jgi:hypothetical protein
MPETSEKAQRIIHEAIRIVMAKLGEIGVDPVTTLMNALKPLTTKSDGKTYLYLIKNHAVTATTLQYSLGIPKTTSYACLTRLEKKHLIEPVTVVQKFRSTPGPKPEVHGLKAHYTQDDVKHAIETHKMLSSSKYREALDVTDAIDRDLAERGGPREIRQRDIYEKMRRMGIKYISGDVVNFVMKDLTLRGVKVWRG